MPSFINQLQIDSITGYFRDHFDTFSSGSNNFISVIKDPIKVVTNTTDTSFPGYSYDTTNTQDVSYQTVSGVFPAIIIYPKNMQSNQFAQLKFNLDDNEVMVKVNQSGRDYMMNGKTQRIIIDGLDYNQNTTPTTQSFLGLRYYYFKLTSTK